MQMISAKQVEGAVDTTSTQTIDGEKTFSTPATFTNPDGSQFAAMRIDGLYLYWLKSLDTLDQDGNLRIGPNPETNLLAMQHYEFGKWQNMNQT